jgi:hypothetical protein
MPTPKEEVTWGLNKAVKEVLVERLPLKKSV